MNIARIIKEWRIKRKKKHIEKLMDARDRCDKYSIKYQKWIEKEREKLYELMLDL